MVVLVGRGSAVEAWAEQSHDITSSSFYTGTRGKSEQPAPQRGRAGCWPGEPGQRGGGTDLDLELTEHGRPGCSHFTWDGGFLKPQSVRSQ